MAIERIVSKTIILSGLVLGVMPIGGVVPQNGKLQLDSYSAQKRLLEPLLRSLLSMWHTKNRQDSSLESEETFKLNL